MGHRAVPDAGEQRLSRPPLILACALLALVTSTASSRAEEAVSIPYEAPVPGAPPTYGQLLSRSFTTPAGMLPVYTGADQPSAPGSPIVEVQAEPVVEPEPPEADPCARVDWPAQLNRDELDLVFNCAEVPEEWRDEAMRVAWGESSWSPGALGDSGASVGLFQLNRETWSRYCGVPPESLEHPVVNTRCAWLTYNYDLERGQAPWTQWSIRPWMVTLP